MVRKLRLAMLAIRDLLVGVGIVAIWMNYTHDAIADFLINGVFFCIAWYMIYGIHASYEDAGRKESAANPLNPGGRLVTKPISRPDIPTLSQKIASAPPLSSKNTDAEDVRCALVHLDYRPRDARRAVRLAVAAGATNFESIYRIAQRELAR